MIAQAREHGPTLVVDAGNALFEAAQPPPLQTPAQSEQARARAELMAKVMGEVGTAAMAVGRRDLTGGVELAQSLSRTAHLPMLSVNLRRKGHPVFPASLVVKVGGLKVALIGVSPAGPLGPQPGVEGELPVALAVAEAKRLRPAADVVIALAAISTADALQLSRDAGGALDVILQSSDLRAGTVPGLGGGAPVFSGGFEGRDLRTLALSIAGKGTGPFVLTSERRQLEQRKGVLTANRETMRQRLVGTVDPAARQSIEQTIANFDQQLVRVDAELEKARQPAGRTLEVSVRALDATVPGDPSVEGRVGRLEPTPAAH